MPHRPQILFPAHAPQHPILSGGTAAIISGENPRFPAELQGNEALQQELDRLGFDYEPTKGKYGAPENSYIVMNPDLDKVLELGKRCGQESVAWTENGRHQLHFVNGPQAGQSTAPSEGHKFSETAPQDNFTAIPGPNGEPFGYAALNMDFDSPLVPSKPTPLVSAQVAPMAKSELELEIRRWAERLGDLRTKELAKGDVIQGQFPQKGPAKPGKKAKVLPLQSKLETKRQGVRARIDSMLEDVSNTMASDPGMIAAQRERETAEKAQLLKRGPQLFRPGHRVSINPSSTAGQEGRVPKDWIGVIKAHRDQYGTEWSDDGSNGPHHMYEVIWKTPQGDRHEDYVHQNDLAPMNKSELHDLLKAEDGSLRKVAPPGFSEDTMHKLKHKYGVESAFKIAWSSHNKKNKSLDKAEYEFPQDDPHQVLGLQRGATPEQVKAKVRELAMKHHPDRGGDPAQMRRVLEAAGRIDKNAVPSQSTSSYRSSSNSRYGGIRTIPCDSCKVPMATVGPPDNYSHVCNKCAAKERASKARNAYGKFSKGEVAPGTFQAPALHNTVAGFLGGLQKIPKGSPERGKFMTQHMNHAPFLSALSQHPQGAQLKSMLSAHLNSAANAGFRPGASQVVAKAELKKGDVVSFPGNPNPVKRYRSNAPIAQIGTEANTVWDAPGEKEDKSFVNPSLSNRASAGSVPQFQAPQLAAKGIGQAKNQYDYTSMLAPEHQQANYSIIVHHNPGMYDDYMHAQVLRNGQEVAKGWAYPHSNEPYTTAAFPMEGNTPVSDVVSIMQSLKNAISNHQKLARFGIKKAEPTDSDAYFHPSEKGSPKKPKPAGPPAENTYRNVPKDYAKREDAGSVIGMISGDVTKINKQEMTSNLIRVSSPKEHKMYNSGKTDPLDGDMAQQHACKGCGKGMSPVVAALRKSKGGMCLGCEKMGKAELQYHNNEPQHQQADTNWKIKCKEPYKAVGSGGDTKKNPVGNSSNDGAKSVTFPMGKAEGMPVPAAPKAPQAPGAAPAQSAGTTKPSGSSAAKPAAAPAPMGKSEKHDFHTKAPEGSPGAGCSACGKAYSHPNHNKDDAFEVWETKARRDQEGRKNLHKAIQETINLRKLDMSSMKGGALQGAHEAPTGIPAAGSMQPKSTQEFGAANFRPASPGAAGASTGLELDTAPKKFAYGNSKPVGAGAMATPLKSASGVRGTPEFKVKQPGPKNALPISQLKGIRGGPGSKV